MGETLNKIIKQRLNRIFPGEEHTNQPCANTIEKEKPYLLVAETFGSVKRPSSRKTAVA